MAAPADVMAPADALATGGLALVVSTGAIPFASSQTIVVGAHAVESNGVEPADLLAPPPRPRFARESETSDGEGALEPIGLDVRGLLVDFIDAEFVRQLLPVTGVDAMGRTSFSVMGIGEFVLERTADGSATKLTETTTGLSYAQNERRDLVGSRGSTAAHESGGAPRPAAVTSKRRLTDLIKDIT